MWKFLKRPEYQIVLEFAEPGERASLRFFDGITSAELKLSEHSTGPFAPRRMTSSGLHPSTP
jgi:hypothetical protein